MADIPVVSLVPRPHSERSPGTRLCFGLVTELYLYRIVISKGGGKLLNTITVRLQWDPLPESPNGIVTGYQVVYSGYRTTVQVQ